MFLAKGVLGGDLIKLLTTSIKFQMKKFQKSTNSNIRHIKKGSILF